MYQYKQKQAGKICWRLLSCKKYYDQFLLLPTPLCILTFLLLHTILYLLGVRTGTYAGKFFTANVKDPHRILLDGDVLILTLLNSHFCFSFLSLNYYVCLRIFKYKQYNIISVDVNSNTPQ